MSPIWVYVAINQARQHLKLQKQTMKTHLNLNKLILLSGALAGIIIANPFTTYAASPTPAPSANSVITWTASGKQSKKVDVLFVQNAKNMTFNKGKLVLRGVNPVTVCFTDRPARMAGHMQTSKLIPLWSQGKDSFLKDNPNATLSVFRGDNVSDLVVELSNPQLSPIMISPSTHASLKALRQPMGELVRCSSMSSACHLPPCPTPASRAGPGVASRKGAARKSPARL